jgi:hypothetical protein
MYVGLGSHLRHRLGHPPGAAAVWPAPDVEHIVHDHGLP